MSKKNREDFFFDEERMKTLFWLGDQIPGGFFVYKNDERQELIYLNDGILHIYGCRTEEEFQELTGNTFKGMVYYEDYDSIQGSIDGQIAQDESGKLDYVEYRIVRRDGEIRWLDDYGHLGSLPGYGEVYFVFVSDATEKRRAMDERFRMELELQQQRRENEMKNAFLFNVSHDIRTPMNAIIGFSELARKHRDNGELLDEYLGKVEQSSQQLLELIDDMLEFNNLETAGLQLKLQPTDLSQQIAMTVDLFRIRAGQKGVALTVESELSGEEVMADQHSLRRMLGNLVSNAVNFTPAGGAVTVRAKRSSLSETGAYGRYELSVEDTGIGMSPQFMERMYQPFEREETSTKAGTTGAGLGLAIVKSLADKMGGTIIAKSEKGKGSCFTVELPLKLSSEEAKAAGDAPVQEDSSRAEGEYRILVVEDIEINRLLAETILEEAGFTVESVPDGSDAVEAVRNHPPGYYDLVLMDIQMPVMNGYEATRAIRAMQREDAGSLPIIALSANAREEDKRQSLDSGMNSHVAKPFDVAMLIATVNEHIARAKGES